MGGKNAVIVDSDADLDDVVPALLKSAFASPARSAAPPPARSSTPRSPTSWPSASRARSARCKVGPAADFGTDVPPVIDIAAQQRIQRLHRRAATPLAAGATRDDGFYVAPTLFDDLPADSPVDQRGDLRPGALAGDRPERRARLRARRRTRAFALTGGLFSRSPRTIEYVCERTPVGNLYVNREITGAMVGRQPFGGGRLSGTGPKAGGPDYLLQFVEARAVTENTVRHGLVV